MAVLVDTREQPSARAMRRYKRFNCPYSRRKLEYGDYAYNFALPNGSPLYGDSDAVNAPVVIERKANLEELSGNLTEKRQAKHKEQHVRNRFEAELKLAKENGASVYLLIEDASLSNVLNHYTMDLGGLSLDSNIYSNYDNISTAQATWNGTW